MSNNSVGKKPWYRHPMVWMVIAIPFSAVVVGIILITLSVQTYDGLVEDDYYKRGKEINLDLARDQYAVDNGISAEVHIEPNTGVISVELMSKKAYQFPDNLGLALLHPTQSRQDRKLLLEKGPDGRYHTALARPLKEGRWYVRISEPNWRLQKKFRYPNKTRVILRP